MNKQPEALRLADALEDDLAGYDGLSLPRCCQDIADEAAAELRRLHAANLDCMEWYKAAKSQRDELLVALQLYLAHASEPECTIWRHVQQKARARQRQSNTRRNEVSAFSAAASDEDGDTISTLRAEQAEDMLEAIGAGGVEKLGQPDDTALQEAAKQARDWIAEHPDRRPVSAGRMVATLTNALAAAPQRQDHTAQHLNMVPEGWKPVPVEPTNEMVQAWLDTYEGNIQTVYRAMLAAAPQPQVEQEPVAELFVRPQNLNCKSNQARLATLWGYVKEQPKREPLSDEQIDEMWREATLKPALTSEFVHAFARAIERAHGIGGEK